MPLHSCYTFNTIVPFLPTASTARFFFGGRAEPLDAHTAAPTRASTHACCRINTHTSVRYRAPFPRPSHYGPYLPYFPFPVAHDQLVNISFYAAPHLPHHFLEQFRSLMSRW